MKLRVHRFEIRIAAAILFTAFGFTVAAKAEPVETVIHNFANSPDGSLPNAGVLVKSGVVYGVSPYGAKAGKYTGSGLVFALSPPAGGQTKWTEKIIHAFGASAGGVTPVGRLVADSRGALYGVTSSGGTAGCLCGVIFKLTPPAAAGGPWVRETLHAFTGGADGGNPQGGLIFGAGGVLYGTTYAGGSDSGVVFKLTPPAAGSTKWTETSLYQFTGTGPNNAVDAHPRGRLLIDKGIIYGTNTGGAYGGGTVFRLAPPAKGKTAWVETVLFAFKNGKEGGDPEGGLAMDAAGTLYGMTEKGGIKNCPSNGFSSNGCGVVFKLTPPAKGAAWKETLLHSFRSGTDGANPLGELLIDAKGALYGTTSNGGNHGCTISGTVYGCGTIFKLSPPVAGHLTWAETTLYRFPETITSGDLYYPNGIEPLDGLAVDPKGRFFGSANVGGVNGVGIVFQLAGTGFAFH